MKVKCALIKTTIFPRPNPVSRGHLLNPLLGLELDTGSSEPLWGAGAHHVVQVVKIP